MKIERMILFVASLLALLLWTGDALVDTWFFYEGTFFGNLLTAIPPVELYMRSANTFMLLGFALLVSTMVRRNRAAEKAFRERETRSGEQARILGSIADQISDAVIVMGLDHRITFMNEAVERIFGPPPRGRSAHDPASLIAGKDRDLYAKHIVPAITSGERWNGEMLYRRRGGGAVVCEAQFFPITNDHGETVAYVGIHRDITERRKVEDQLLRKSEFLNDILQSLTHPFYIVDAETYRILLANAASGLEDLSGGTTCFSHGHHRSEPCRGPGHECVLEEIKRTKAPATVEHVHFDPRGRPRYYEVHGYPILDKSGRVEQIIEYNLDVTARRTAEGLLRRSHEELEEKIASRTAELRASNERLTELDRLKSLFIASMSHELRTPLNAIIGFTGIMLQGLAGEISKEQEKQLKMVMGSGRHLLDLVNDILDVSKIESGHAEIFPREFDLAATVKDTTEGLRLAASRTGGVSLTLDLPGSLPVLSDERLVRQVITNLVGNALKFTDRGSVRVSCRGTESRVEVTVTDTGRGIREEHMGALFQPFSRIGERGLARKEGTGLGLYLSSRIAGLLGGEISVKSRYGQGSEFTFSLPARFRRSGKRLPPPARSAGPSGPPGTRPPASPAPGGAD